MSISVNSFQLPPAKPFYREQDLPYPSIPHLPHIPTSDPKTPHFDDPYPFFQLDPHPILYQQIAFDRFILFIITKYQNFYPRFNTVQESLIVRIWATAMSIESLVKSLLAGCIFISQLFAAYILQMPVEYAHYEKITDLHLQSLFYSLWCVWSPQRVMKEIFEENLAKSILTLKKSYQCDVTYGNETAPLTKSDISFWNRCKLFGKVTLIPIPAPFFLDTSIPED
jgi:hypothetical protein